MGTDDAGRDVLTRGVYGGRISLRIGFWVALVSMTLGVAMGLISGYYATTWIDDVINAIIMTLGSIPLLFLLIILSRIFQPGPEGLAILIGIFGWMGLSRLVRGQIFSIREREYIIASRAIGTPAWKIMVRHVMPNVSSIIIVSAIFGVAGAIIAEAGLSYLGRGHRSAEPKLGQHDAGLAGQFPERSLVGDHAGNLHLHDDVGHLPVWRRSARRHGPVDHEVASLQSGNTRPARSCAGLSFGGRFDVEEV